MDQMRHLIAFLFFLICAKAQNTKKKHEEEEEEMSPLHPSMAVVLVVLSLMFCLTFLILAYAKFCHRVEPRPSNLLPTNGAVGSRSRFSGVDKTLIESLPFFRFSTLKGSKEGLECAICLSRFEETELLRLLPKCRHAFHMSCIDMWLENHSSCPICRYKFEANDIKSSRYSTSFRVPSTSREEAGIEFFIQREQNQGRSSRFNLANTFQRLARGRRDEALIGEFKNTNSKETMHNVKHRIIVSDVMHKSRWSDVNSSDMISLSSEMLGAMARKGMSSSGRFNEDDEAEQILKIKEDMERKRLVESKILARTETSNSGESSRKIEMEARMMSRSSDPSQKRSMSEITNFSRFREMNSSSNSNSRRFSTSQSSEKDDRVRKLWLPIARRTIQLFSGQETSSEARQQTTNV